MKALAAVAAALVLGAATPLAAQDEAGRLMRELESGEAVGTAFTLTDPKGRQRSLADFRGKVVVLYFGFTTCPDVCPTDLLQIARAVRAQGRHEREVQPVFVTLDPERDTANLLGSYAKAFHPRLVALRGTEAETRRIARAFKVYYRRVPRGSGTDYAIDHVAIALILDREGRYVDFIHPGTPSGRMAVMIRETLDRRPR